uniref:Uncharacterized protein n=1 Tax=Anguilla anguilla TaxID=7936 RepID=A0A0E9TVM9_ANGAN
MYEGSSLWNDCFLVFWHCSHQKRFAKSSAQRHEIKMLVV